MKKLIFILLSALFVQGAFAWGQKGHDVTAYIAQGHLTPQAAARIDKILGGHSPVYYANWLDIASHQPEYAFTKTWHYLNIDKEQTFETMPKNPTGDVVSAINSIVEKLKSGVLTPEQETLNLKMLIHLLGDIHCPMHMGRLSDLGGNKRPVLFFREATNLHSVWDSAIVEAAHKWSYTEWQQQIDRLPKVEVAQIAAGTPEDWARETHAICVEVYAKTPEGFTISYDYIYDAAPIIEHQFLRGGYRLARLLNEIYQ